MKKVLFIIALMSFMLTSISVSSQGSIPVISPDPIDGYEDEDPPSLSDCSVDVMQNGQEIRVIHATRFSQTINITIEAHSCWGEQLELRLTNSNQNLIISSTHIPSNGSAVNISITIPANNTPVNRYFIFDIISTRSSGDIRLPFGFFQISQSGDPTLQTFYRDTDEDGYGDYGSNPIYRHSQPSRTSTNNLDRCPREYSTINNGCKDLYEDNENYNWTRSEVYDISGRLVGANKGYYNGLGKIVQSQSYDIKTQKNWASETFYDSQGRPAVQTLAAPVATGLTSDSFSFKENFVLNASGQPFTSSDYEEEELNPSIVNSTSNTLGGYFNASNVSESLRDITDRPYSRTIYSELIPGGVKQVIGGNQINGQWKQGYSFSMPAAQEMYYVFGTSYYDAIPSISDNYQDISNIFNTTSNTVAWLRASKTIVQDVKGNESVVFTDADGKTLAAARSGGEKQYEVVSLIGEQGFVDIHIPKGVHNSVTFIGSDSSNFTIYNLKTEEEVSVLALSHPGFFRIQYNGDRQLTKSHALTYIDAQSNNSIKPAKEDEAVGVRYNVNYYDYSLNYYNIVGQLTSSLQPLGFNDDCLDNLQATVNHNDELKSSFVYNSLGQLVETTSPDEGTARFKYRKDGQIRFSQNSKQLDPNEDNNTNDQEFSYTNYDVLARPVESGVSTGTFSSLNADDETFSGIRREQHFTEYDYVSDEAQARLNSFTINASYKNLAFLSGNVVRTYNKEANTIISETFYSYDVHGRVTFIVQYLNGLGVKTIDYEYDPVTSQVLKVIFQKNTNEQFVHRYSYDQDDQSLIEVATSVDNINFTTHANYEYYESGALRRTILAKDATNPNGIQDIDYVYNLSGQLKSINHPSLAEDPELNPYGTDLFGLTLDYYSGDYRRDINRFSYSTDNEDQYNGNIKAMTWNTNFNNEVTSPLQYKYTYNENNWLSSAIFDGMGNQQNSAAETVTLNYGLTRSLQVQATNAIVLQPGFHVEASDVVNFSSQIVNANSNGTYLNGDYDVTNLEYDANGNIQRLFRNKNTENGSNEMDKLTYTYKTDKPNQLDHIDDAVIAETNADDIKDQNVNNYRYNKIGQLTDNIGEGVSYTYNASGLVTEVKYNNIIRVSFKYNDKNFRTKKLTYNADGNLTKTTYYILDVSGTTMAIYEDQQQKELPIYGASRLGVYNKETGVSVYQLTDHLGNVRAVIAKDANGNAAALTTATDYYPFGMPMPNRQIVNGEPYRYGYQGQEVDPETGKPAFQLRLWDARIGRWLTTDPYGQFASPYLGMGNNPISNIDPDGGFSGPNDPPNDVDGGMLDEVVINGNTNNTSGYTPTTRDWEILSMLQSNAPNIFNSVNQRYQSGDYFQLGGGNYHGFSENYRAGWLNFDPNGIANTISKVAVIGIGGPLILSNPVTASISIRAGSISFKGWQGRVAYDFASELVANNGDIKNVNFLGVALSSVSGSKFLELVGAGVDLTINDGIVIKSVEQTFISFHAGRLNGRLTTNGFVSSLAPAILQGYVKKGEDFINSYLGDSPIFGIHKLN